MTEHITVLQAEAVSALRIQPESVIVDATFGVGGHSALIASKLDKNGTIICIDVDKSAIESGREKLNEASATKEFVVGNFKDIKEHLRNLNISHVDGIMADLGWRMEQFSNSERGFSFTKDEPLLMTLGEPEEYLFTAHDIINEWDEEDIANVIYAYGEERFARKIARAIVEYRKESPIATAKELATLIGKVVPKRGKPSRIHAATKTFQALRIAVNDELKVLEQFIDDSIELLNSGGRLAVISFHSLEDRIVKHRFREFANEEIVLLLTKKPIKPTDEELHSNPRARSAKLRIIEKL